MAKTMQTTPTDPTVEAMRQDRAAAYAARLAQAKAEQWEALAKAKAHAAALPHEAGNGLLRDNKFYLSRTISVERRRELRELIQNNGGEVLNVMTRGAVELVENESLKAGEEWVSVDFIYNTVRDQTLPDPRQYMASDWQSTAQNRSAAIAGQPKRQGRMMYTVEDDAKMFMFLEVAPHTADSMHEHYRRILAKYTPLQRRNVMKNAKDEEDARQRSELAAINAKPANPKASTKTATTVSPAKEKKSAPEVTSAEAQVSEATPEEPQATREANNVSTPEDNVPEEKSSVPIAEGGDNEANEEEEEEEIQRRGKKRARTSAPATAAEQKPASPNKNEVPRKETVAGAEDPQTPGAAAVATAAAAHSEPADDSADSNNVSSKEKKPEMSSKKQQKQKLARKVASSQRDDEEDKPVAKTTELTKPVAAADTKKKTRSGYPPASPPSREVGTGGIFFRSRWEQLINDTSNREQLQQYFTLARPREASTGSAPAVRGRILRKPTPGVRAALAHANKNNGETALTTGSSAAATTRRRKRTEGPAPAAAAAEEEEEEEEEEDKETRSATPAPSKKQKVRQASQPQKTAGAPAVGATPSRVTVHEAPAQVEQEEVIVTTESEVGKLTCQLQFATDQEVNTVTHALYYSSGDVEVALSFLRGACPADFWSEEDDLLLANLMSDATDARKVVDARRRGAFASMRVQRTAAQILTRIRYLL